MQAEMDGKYQVIESYTVETDNLKVETNIIHDPKEFVNMYYLNFPSYGAGTSALLTNLKKSLVAETAARTGQLDMDAVEKIRGKFVEKAQKMLDSELPTATEETKKALVGILMHEMLGLGRIEFLLSDGNLEEIVINRSQEPVWVYHKKYGWLKTNVRIETEADIENYANIIARRVGKQITILSPLLDAHLITGDRANATLFPISSKGNTVTIRRFRRDPWTVTDFIKTKTVSAELMALIWEAMEYELNIIISGGTASGKTSFLNVCMPFIQPNHRVLSIEDTRELMLPDYLHWVPLTTREPNPEGKGGITMLDLLVNSLRMRPDRVIVGEVRRQREAEVMFEAMHTGHSVYTTIHANTADETITRLVNPPVSIPVSMLDSVHLNIVMFRNRRLGSRRVLEAAEFIPEKRGKELEIKPNIIYRWRSSDDQIVAHNESIRFYDELSLHTGMSQGEIQQELKTKTKILNWMIKFDIHNVNEVGKIMAQCYQDIDEIKNLVEKNKKPEL
ncbi:MAG: type II/IV secretion system ATPase subunit [Candidatus ainarchaeum sp.]|nr:type II/IV secretion system ATPase subunit [Candidatus ainarchaeum sp.]